MCEWRHYTFLHEWKEEREQEKNNACRLTSLELSSFLLYWTARILNDECARRGQTFNQSTLVDNQARKKYTYTHTHTHAYIYSKDMSTMTEVERSVLLISEEKEKFIILTNTMIN